MPYQLISILALVALTACGSSSNNPAEPPDLEALCAELLAELADAGQVGELLNRAAELDPVAELIEVAKIMACAELVAELRDVEELAPFLMPDGVMLTDLDLVELDAGSELMQNIDAGAPLPDSGLSMLTPIRSGDGGVDGGASVCFTSDGSVECTLCPGSDEPLPWMVHVDCRELDCCECAAGYQATSQDPMGIACR